MRLIPIRTISSAAAIALLLPGFAPGPAEAQGQPRGGQGEAVQAAAGIAAVIAHDWNPWLGFSGGRGIGQTIGVLLVLSWVALGLFVIVALIGVVTKAVPQFIALALVLTPAAALVSGQPAAIVAACGALAAIALLKRLLANGVAENGTQSRAALWRNRLLFDRDIRDREAWVRRGLP